MHRKNIIQKLIDKNKSKSYLEIGIGDGEVFESIKCEKKTSVDPCISDGSEMVSPTFKLRSDDFFKQNKYKFDAIFIDGLHEADQVERDIYNSLEVLNEGGFIVCHDMNPTSENMQKVPQVQGEWTGDCWKAWVRIRSKEKNLNMLVVNTDYGCGVIERGAQDIIDIQEGDLTYFNFCKNKQRWLNLVSVSEFDEN